MAPLNKIIYARASSAHPSLIVVVPVRSRSANQVVGEFGVSARDLIPRHVTGDAILGAPRADCGWGAEGRFRAFCRHMAMETAIIVGARVARQGLVRVVTGQAGDTGISLLSPAPAEFKAVRLKANGRDPLTTGRHHVCPGMMTGSTEIHGINRVQFGGIQDQLPTCGDSPFLHCRNMPGAGAVTGLASNP